MALEFLVHRVQLVAFNDLAGLEFAVAGIDDQRVVDDAPTLDLAVGRFDEPEFVDSRVARKRADQSDVRAFRRLNRADAAVVRRMNVADLESGALPRESAGPQGRQTPLVRDFAEWIGLVHELATVAKLPKNSRIAAMTGLAFTRSCGMAVDIS